MAKATSITIQNLSFNSVDDRDILGLINKIRLGIEYSLFAALVSKSPFSLTEWSHFLHLSERTMQRYKREKKTFDAVSSEKIVEIALLYKLGVGVFGSQDNFNTWLETKNVALGGSAPKEFLDNTFGIGLVKDELIRIESGVLA